MTDVILTTVNIVAVKTKKFAWFSLVHQSVHYEQATGQCKNIVMEVTCTLHSCSINIFLKIMCAFVTVYKGCPSYWKYQVYLLRSNEFEHK